jgi:iron(III) transport system ATP-binding protein
MWMGDRIGLMRDGRLAQIGSAETLYRRPVDLSAARFVTDINEFDCSIESGSALTPLGPLECRGHPNGSQVIVGVRPQGIRLGAPPTGAPGRVISENFLGEVDHLEIAIAGFDTLVRARVRGDKRFPVGSEVGVRIDPGEAMVFAKPS